MEQHPSAVRPRPGDELLVSASVLQEEERQALQIRGLAQANVELRAQVEDLKAALRVRQSPLRAAGERALEYLRQDPGIEAKRVVGGLRAALDADG